MKKVSIFLLCLLGLTFNASLSAQNVGIGTANPLSRLSINGNTSIGAGYVGATAPANGLLIEGNVGIGTTSPNQKLEIAGWIELGNETEGTTGTAGALRYHAGSKILQFHDGTTWRNVYSTSNGGDNLGNHIATQNLNMGNFQIDNVSFLDVTPGNGNGLRFWSSDLYSITMGNTADYKYGDVTDYSIKMNMNNQTDRGWTWGVYAAAPIAALNTQGNLQINGDFTVFGGDIDMVKGQSSRIHSLGEISFDWTTNGQYDNAEFHGLQSKDEAGNWGDELRINSYNDIINTIDGNGNDATSYFKVQHHSATDGPDLFWVRSADGYAYHSGRLGIGTTSPGEMLDIAGNVTASLYYDRDNTSYYVDPASTTLLNEIGWGTSGSRTQTKDDAGGMGGRSGFFESSSATAGENWPSGSTGWWHLLETRHSNTANNYSMQFAGSFFDQNLYFRKTNNSASTAWSQIYTTSSPPPGDNLGNHIATVGIKRSNHHIGHLEGSYNNVGANSTFTNPIYTIGSAYNPSVSTLDNMYGIGYSHNNFWGSAGDRPTGGWGQYVAADGDIRIILEASTGTIWSEGTIRSNGGFRVDGNVVIDDGAGWHRSYGATGWYNGTYGGGVYMDQSTYVRVYNNKGFTAIGDVGIGTNTPSYKLHAYSSAALGNSTVVNGQSAGTSGVGVSGSISNTSNTHAAVEGYTSAPNGSGTKGLHLPTSGGGIGIYGVTNAPSTGWGGYFAGDVYCAGIYFGSDSKFKKNTESLEEFNVLDKLMQVEPKVYEYDAEKFPGMGFSPGKKYYGFIAQDLEKLFPDMVATNKGLANPYKKAEAHDATTMEEGYYMVDYVSMVPILVQATKDQQKLILELSAKIEQLQAQINNK